MQELSILLNYFNLSIWTNCDISALITYVITMCIRKGFRHAFISICQISPLNKNYYHRLRKQFLMFPIKVCIQLVRRMHVDVFKIDKFNLKYKCEMDCVYILLFFSRAHQKWHSTFYSAYSAFSNAHSLILAHAYKEQFEVQCLATWYSDRRTGGVINQTTELPIGGLTTATLIKLALWKLTKLYFYVNGLHD